MRANAAFYCGAAVLVSSKDEGRAPAARGAFFSFFHAMANLARALLPADSLALQSLRYTEIAYRRREEPKRTKQGAFIYGGDVMTFEDWRFSTMVKWRGSKEDDKRRAEAVEKIIQKIREYLIPIVFKRILLILFI